MACIWLLSRNSRSPPTCFTGTAFPNLDIQKFEFHHRLWNTLQRIEFILKDFTKLLTHKCWKPQNLFLTALCLGFQLRAAELAREVILVA